MYLEEKVVEHNRSREDPGLEASVQLRPRMEKRRHSDLFSILIIGIVTPLHLRTRGD